MNGLLWDVILGREFLKLYESFQFTFGGPEQSLQLGVLKPLKCPNPVRLYAHMTPDGQPIVAKSRNYSKADQEFIETRISQLLADDIIEPSVSPWRAQMVIAQSENRKKRLCVDYSQTVNKFTRLNAYRLPSMQNIVSNVANYKWYSSLNLRSTRYVTER